MQPSRNSPEELAIAALRELFESRGFRRTRPGRFEDYNLYAENRNFLTSGHAITFMDMDGRLLALKSDVTLSIVKNIPDSSLSAFEKLYYIDEVYRVSPETHEYKVLSQIGVELIGPSSPLSNIEAIDLALHSLSLIGSDFVLDVSHLGFISGLIDSINLPVWAREQALAAVYAKSTHELKTVLENSGVCHENMVKLLVLSEMRGPLRDMLSQLSSMCVNDCMHKAVQELKELCEALNGCGYTDRLFVDFSVVGDLDYYNGLLFRGYIEGVPKAVLSGGRYDNLLRRMGKESYAIGFGVELSELNIHRKRTNEFDFDALIIYDDGCDLSALLAAQKNLSESGARVRLEPSSSDEKTFSPLKIYRFTQSNILLEVPTC